MTIATAQPLREYGTEGLRGFAALLVLYTHLLWPDALLTGYRPWSGFMALEASQGAVLLFFILSGYVIGLSNNGPFTVCNSGHYLWRRIVRLAPLCWAALLLGEWVRPTHHWPTILGNALFLQNAIPYGSLSIPPVPANSNIWTLNYEAIYYLLFIVCWFRPKAWPVWLGTALILSIVLWALPGTWAPLGSCYATGWIFWLIGLGMSRLPFSPVASMPLPWISILLFWFVTWQQKPLWALCHRFHVLPPDSAAWINYSFIDIIPASVVLLLAASGRRLLFTRQLCWLAALIPLSFLLWTVARGRMTSMGSDHFGPFCIAACLLWKWRPEATRVWGKFAYVGSISYGLYILQRPVQWLVLDSGLLPANVSTPTFILRLGICVTLTFAFAWVMEAWLQPRLRSWLVSSRRPSLPVLV